MTALQQLHASPDGPSPCFAPGSTPALPPTEPGHQGRRGGEPRFPNDWITATLRLCPESRHVLLSTESIDWLLEADDFDALAKAAAGAPGSEVQWNPDLGRLLVPGGHERGSRSFFSLGA